MDEEVEDIVFTEALGGALGVVVGELANPSEVGDFATLAQAF